MSLQFEQKILSNQGVCVGMCMCVRTRARVCVCVSGIGPAVRRSQTVKSRDRGNICLLIWLCHTHTDADLVTNRQTYTHTTLKNNP